MSDSDLLHVIPMAAEWPDGAEFTKQNLSQSLIEEHGYRVLARAMATGRLVAFAGAGVSMAYGRITWGQLLDRLFELQEAKAQAKSDAGPANDQDRQAFNRARWLRLRNALWADGAQDFQHGKGRYEITAQLFDEFWLGQGEDQAVGETMKHAVADMADSAWGRFWQICQTFSVRTPDKNRQKALREYFDKVWVLEARSTDSSGLELLGYLLRIVENQSTNKKHLKAFSYGLAKRYAKAYASFLDDASSPVKTLASDLGISRLLTTNYDLEIERGLGVFRYAEIGKRALAPMPGHQRDGALHDAWRSTQTLDRDSTGEAMCFAVDGPRRHRQVLHLHGDCTRAQGLVVTEVDYQRLYVDRHDKLDLVQNAVGAAFAANPLLFVGSNMGEDDILRPLRQFMTGPAHQRDRMAVALLPASDKPEKDRYMVLELYLKYGVHAIYFGSINTEMRTETGAAHKAFPWLVKARGLLGGITSLLQTHVELMKVSVELLRISALTSPTEADQRDEQQLQQRREKLGDLFLSSCESWIDSNNQKKREETLSKLKGAASTWVASNKQAKERLRKLGERLGSLLTTFNTFVVNVKKVPAALSEMDQLDIWINHSVALRLVAEELGTQITTHLFCCKLQELYGHAMAQQRRQMALPRTLDRNLIPTGDQRRTGWHVFHRNRIASSSAGGAAFEALIQDLLRHRSRLATDGQRTVLVTGTRGMGLGALFDSLGDPDCSRRLAEALRGYTTDSSSRNPVVHINLAFSDEVSNMVQHVVSTIIYRLGTNVDEKKAPSDLLERLAWALDQLQEQTLRCLIMIGNAGVLFEDDGKPKNGLLSRLWQLLDEHSKVPVDFVLVCQEQLIPERYRRKQDDTPLAPQLDHPGPPNHRERDRRLDRLNIRLLESQKQFVVLHTLINPALRHVLEVLCSSPRGADGQKDRGSMLIDGYEEKLTDLLGGSGNELALESRLERLIPHRFALTLVLTQALVLEEAHKELAKVCMERVLERVWSGSKEMVAERAIEAVLDNWHRVHLKGVTLVDQFVPRFISDSWDKDSTSSLRVPNQSVCSPQQWHVISEVLWHLSMFSRPVELDVLMACPAIQQALVTALESMPRGEENSGLCHSLPKGLLQCLLLHSVMSQMESWCLIYRVEPRYYRQGLFDEESGQHDTEGREYRYTVHRQMQKYHLRLSGGRNVESGRWDHFATTLYASQPDDMPALPLDTYRKLVDVIKRLTRYPDPRFAVQLQHECKDFLASSKSEAEEEHEKAQTAQSLLRVRLCRLRAAYFLIRSNFSLGVIAHMSDTGVTDSTTCGLMEEYRRLTRWVTREAYRWQEDAAKLGALPECAVFFPGELVWLLNECGVIALAQGKLDEADTLLGLAEQAASRIEADDTGSIHVRIRLHAALVQIERGRPGKARPILTPIAARLNGHEVPPFIAEYYLGLIEHLGGNYKQAHVHYNKAAEGFRKGGRSRALALVLQSQADLYEVMHEGRSGEASAQATDAINLAQQGGHEDVRVISMLTQVRLKTTSRDVQSDKLFSELSFAERYANRMDMPRIACEVQVTTARLLLSQGETRMSASRASAALEIAALYDLKLMKARALLTLAQIYQRRGELAGARQLVRLGKELAVSGEYYSCVRGFRELELHLEGIPKTYLDGRASA